MSCCDQNQVKCGTFLVKGELEGRSNKNRFSLRGNDNVNDLA